MLRLIKQSGESISINYSDILNIKLPEKNRIYLLMRNDDTYDIYGRDLYLCLRDLEDRMIVALAESHPGEVERGEAWIQNIASGTFQVPALRKIGSTPVFTAPFARHQNSDLDTLF